MLVADGLSLPALSCVFVAPDEAAFAARAGCEGLDVVVVQFPNHRDHLPEASAAASSAPTA